MISHPDSRPSLVSIVVITYNSSLFIEETLESCKNQTYTQLELIVSDDASTDNTLEICKQWLAKHKDRFKSTLIVESEMNTGVAENVNRGVLASKGEWFKLIAGDDLLMDHCITYNMSCIDQKDVKICIYNTIKQVFSVENGNRKIMDISGRIERRNIFFDEGNTAQDQLNLAVRIVRPSVNGHFINRKMFIDIGMCDPEFPMHEDRPLLIKILEAGNKIYGDNTSTVLYRQHENSIFQSGSNSNIYKPWFFNSEIPVIIRYYFPYFNKIERLSYQYSFFIANLTVKLGLNKRSFINKVFNKVLLLPFRFFFNVFQNRAINSVVNRKKNING